ncbi:DsbE family thiol:disulfide interchange protein [Shimia thalassica]|uniref:DsbE family thiol:disulfide interchange protein n=1 Tax=Shimia thalassica TaxID=1715693 RepID=UPI002494930E|nr:DsbE family thiol:disulfide interchange protein [Shimia thalassica]MDO6521250.1 DsbE family thiol:disulfide interchange protein [Shimia thalassica]
MAKVSPLMIAPPLIFAGLAALFFFGMSRENPDELPTALAGKVAPAVALEPFGDREGFNSETLKDGKVKLVNFWASWCAPCRVEHPTLMQLEAEGVAIYGINYKDSFANGNKFLTDLGDPFLAIGSDPKGRMALNWGVYGVPETYLVDGEGRIVTRVAGPLTQRELNDRILPKLKELGIQF